MIEENNELMESLETIFKEQRYYKKSYYFIWKKIWESKSKSVKSFGRILSRLLEEKFGQEP